MKTKCVCYRSTWPQGVKIISSYLARIIDLHNLAAIPFVRRVSIDFYFEESIIGIG